MAFNYSTRIGGNKAPSSKSEEKVQSKIWLNIGVYRQHMIDGEEQTKFVKLCGIALDTMEHKPVTGDSWLADLRRAEKDLWDQAMEFAVTLEPGEERTIIGEGEGLVAIVRRVREEVEHKLEANPFSTKLAFA